MSYNSKKRAESEKITTAFIPNGKDSVSALIRKSLFLLSVAAIVTFSVLIIMNLQKDDEISRSRELSVNSGIFGRITLDTSVSTPRETLSEPLETFPEYLSYYEHNDDMVGWVYIPNTGLSYAVYQAVDNEYYLHRNASRQPAEHGAVFADAAVPFGPGKKRPNNTVLYGHNYDRNGSAIGSIFATVTYYNPRGSRGDFYLSHPLLEFDTLYERGVYKIFAAAYFNTLDKHGEVYPYFTKRSFSNRLEFYDFAVNIMDRSEFITDADLRYGDEIITLSTCVDVLGGLDDEIRFVVFARRVRPDEEPEPNLEAYHHNPSVRYFDHWYNYRGGSWEGRGWDLNLVEGLEEFIEQNRDLPEVKKWLTNS
ncbi:MAG: class B sortase [Oscillospiraceae bacterium]|nr:class B sortase [Oscillospiraceae bacterium]